MIPEWSVLIGSVFNLIGSTSYARDTLLGKTSPNRVTWFMWALAPLIAFSAQISKGVGLSSLMTFMVGFGPLTILIASFFNKKSVWKIGKLDVVCGGLSLMGLLIWLMIREGNIAILFSIFADFLAGVPTVIKAYKQPETESSLVFLFGAVSSGIALLTLNNWNFEYVGFPLYIFIFCSVLYPIIKFRLGTKFGQDPIHKERLNDI